MSEQYAYPGYEQATALLERLKRDKECLDADSALFLVRTIEFYASQAQALRELVKDLMTFLSYTPVPDVTFYAMDWQKERDALQARAKELLGD